VSLYVHCFVIGANVSATCSLFVPSLGCILLLSGCRHALEKFTALQSTVLSDVQTVRGVFQMRLIQFGASVQW